MPIYMYEINFPFTFQNGVLIFCAILLFKHVFFLKYTWLNHFQKIKIALIPLSIPIIVSFMRMLNAFTTYTDEQPLADMMGHMSFEDQKGMVRYIKIEYVIVAVMAIAAAIIMPFRMLVSVWREVKAQQ